MHDASACPSCRGFPRNHSWSDAEFHAFVHICRQELEQKQASLRVHLRASARWTYDLDAGTITIGGTPYPIIAIGTYSLEHQSWLWGWANDGFSEPARASARVLQALHDVTGFRVFLDPGCPASADDVNDLLAMAVHQLEAIGFFRCPSDGTTLYLAMLNSSPGLGRKAWIWPWTQVDRSTT